MIDLARQALHDDIVEARRNVGGEGARFGTAFRLVAQGQRQRHVVARRPPPGQHLEQDQADSIDVGACVDALAAGLLGREIGHRAHHGADRRDLLDPGVIGDAEVHHDRAALAVDHDVARLEIAMDDAALVDGGDARA
ncbi:MAG: hypothetical protein MUF51_01575, partial [Vicinamibacteria bacterium]|nr:hypothetical protein [Vicinamibacteria bacterium]